MSAPRRRTRRVVWLAVAGGVLVILTANAHLLYAAVTSRPDCVAHVRAGEGAGQLGAAASSCTPPRTATQG